MLLSVLPNVECSCDKCKKMCDQCPCWPTPLEALALILAGHAGKMMQDWWVLPTHDVFIITPAVIGYGGCAAPQIIANKGCTFHNKDRLCDIHHMKPVEGRLANCQGEGNSGLREEIAALWDTQDGRDVVAIWEETIAEKCSKPWRRQWSL